MAVHHSDILGHSQAHVSNTCTEVTNPHVIDGSRFTHVGGVPTGISSSHTYGYAALVSEPSSFRKISSHEHFFGTCHIPLNVGVMLNILITVMLVAVLSVFPLNAVSIRSMEHVTATFSNALANTLAESISANLYYLPYAVRSFAASWLVNRVTPSWPWTNRDMPTAMQQMCNTASFVRFNSHLLHIKLSSPYSGYGAYCSPQYSSNYLIGRYDIYNESGYRYLIDQQTFQYAKPMSPYLPVKKMTQYDDTVTFGGTTNAWHNVALPWYESYLNGFQESLPNIDDYPFVEDGWYVSTYGNVSLITYTIPFIDYMGNLAIISAGLQPSGIAAVFSGGSLSADVGKVMVVEPKTGMVLVNSWGQSTHITNANWNYEFLMAEDIQIAKGLHINQITDSLMSHAVEQLGGQEGLQKKPTEVSRWQVKFSDDGGGALAHVTRIQNLDGKLDLLVVYVVSKSEYTANIGTVRAAVIASVVVILLLIAFVDLVLVYLFLQPLRGVAAGLQESSQLKDGSAAVEGRISMIKEVAEMQYHFKIMNAQLMRMKAFLPQGVLGPASGWSECDSHNESELGESANEVFASTVGCYRDGSSNLPGHHDADGANLHLNERVLLDEVNKFRRRYCTILSLVLHVREVDTSVSTIDHLVSVFMDCTIPSILRFGGVIEVQRPDHIVVSFGSHSRLPMHQTRAAKCALEIMGIINYSTTDGPRVGCMLDVGEYYVGTCGAAQRHARVTYGIRTPMMSELVKLCKSLDSQILVTQQMASALDEHMLTVPVDSIIYTLSCKCTIVYELRGSSKWLPAYVSELEVRTLIRQVRLAFTRMMNGDYENAIQFLEPYELKDKQVARLARVCRALIAKKITKPYVRTMGRIKLTDSDIAYEDDPRRTSRSIGDHISNRGSTLAPPQTIDAPLFSAGPSSSARLIEGVAVGGMDGDESGADGGALFEMIIEDDDDDDGTGVEETPAASQEGMLTGVTNRPLVTTEHLKNGELPTTFVDFEGNEWSRSADRLGEGAFSVVYRGLSRSGNLVALKCFQLRAHNIDAQAVTEEIRVFASLHHENIVQYVGAYVSDFYIIEIMELVPGGSLDAMLTSFGSLSTQAVRRYLQDILRGLSYLHGCGIVHCDIKPHNVLLAMDGQCKLSDFGSAMAKATGSVGCIDDVLDMRGTPGYMAPEVALGEIPTMSSDIFSLGVSILELLTGRLPWEYVDTDVSRNPRAMEAVATEESLTPLERGCQHSVNVGDPFTEKSHRRPIEQVLRNATQLIVHISRGLVYPMVPDTFDEYLVDFLQRCLRRNPEERATAVALMNHPWLM